MNKNTQHISHYLFNKNEAKIQKHCEKTKYSLTASIGNNRVNNRVDNQMHVVT